MASARVGGGSHAFALLPLSYLPLVDLISSFVRLG